MIMASASGVVTPASAIRPTGAPQVATLTILRGQLRPHLVLGLARARRGASRHIVASHLRHKSRRRQSPASSRLFPGQPRVILSLCYRICDKWTDGTRCLIASFAALHDLVMVLLDPEQVNLRSIRSDAAAA